MMQQCFVMIKPEGLLKSLTGNIITTLSETKLRIVGAKIVKPSRELVEKHYEMHKTKPFFAELVKHLMGQYHTDRVMAMVYEGEDAISKIRAVCGATNPDDADPITIRGKYGKINSKTHVFENVVHASDSPESAEKEIKLWFKPGELVDTIYPTEKKVIKEEVLVWK
jgi:nucleoside-diphosphate kinase